MKSDIVCDAFSMRKLTVKISLVQPYDVTHSRSRRLLATVKKPKAWDVASQLCTLVKKVGAKACCWSPKSCWTHCVRLQGLNSVTNTDSQRKPYSLRRRVGVCAHCVCSFTLTFSENCYYYLETSFSESCTKVRGITMFWKSSVLELRPAYRP